MRARGLIAGATALVLGVVCVGNALVQAKAASNPAFAGSLWGSHPMALRAVAMAQVGEAAGRGQLPSAVTMERLRKLAARAPLEADPFVVEAAIASKAGEFDRAERLLVEARRRDPRSPATRFLLADMYMRAGAVLEGLREMVVLGRLVNGIEAQLASSLATYAQSPGAVPKLKQVLRENPELEPQLLAVMAVDASNAEMVLTLASRTGPVPGTAPSWRAILLQSLVKAGQYEKAHAAWGQFAGEPPLRLLYRPDFSPSRAPPPFNWSFVGSGGGVAEPISGGGLRVLYFGRDDVALASQTTLLPSGRYQLSMTVTGEAAAPNQLSWAVSCLPGGKILLQLPVGRSKQRALSGQFDVPAEGCEAQQFELRGVGAELPKSSDLQIGPLRLTRVTG